MICTSLSEAEELRMVRGYHEVQSWARRHAHLGRIGSTNAGSHSRESHMVLPTLHELLHETGLLTEQTLA
jgi:hypothetical protein